MIAPSPSVLAACTSVVKPVAAEADNAVSNPPNSPLLVETPCQMSCSVFSATFPPTYETKKSLKFLGISSNAEYPSCKAFQESINSDLHNSRFTCSSFGSRILSDTVTVPPDTKLQEASATIDATSTF